MIFHSSVYLQVVVFFFFTKLSSSPSGKNLVLLDSQSTLVCTYNHRCVYCEHWYFNKYNCNPALEVLERLVHKIQTLNATLGVCMRCTSVWWPKSHTHSTGCASGSELYLSLAFPHIHIWAPTSSPIKIFSLLASKKKKRMWCDVNKQSYVHCYYNIKKIKLKGEMSQKILSIRRLNGE